MDNSHKISEKIENEFQDIQIISEQSLKKFWMNQKDEIWNQYLKSDKK